LAEFFGGGGTIGGATRFQSGATLSPGANSIGTLNFGNNLFIAAGQPRISSKSTKHRKPMTW